METARYLDCLAQDYALLLSATVSASLETPVPSCPGWTVADLAAHVGEVYLHKATVMRDDKWPDPWPPAEHSGLPPLTLLDDGYHELTAEFAARSPDDPSPTWYEPEQTVGFWIRRMAQETVVHRMDAQLAAGLPVTPAPDDLATDGVDEALKRFLAYGSVQWPDEYATVRGGHLATAEGTDTIIVIAGAGTGQTSWTVRPTPATVTVTDGRADGVRAEIAAGPDAMLRWLWGRAGDDAVMVTGDPDWAAYLRRLLGALTV
jgi:uncharacterized protein (TIGR03083 family)